MARKATGGIGETLKTIIYAIVIALFIRTFFYEPFSIPSASMVPTLLVGDYLFVSKFSYGYSRYSLPFGLPLFSGRIFFNEPQRGDVVVFKLPCQYPQLDAGDGRGLRRALRQHDRFHQAHGRPARRQDPDEGRHPQHQRPAGEARAPEPYFCTEDGRTRDLSRNTSRPCPTAYRHSIIELSDDQPLDNTDEFTVPPDTLFHDGRQSRRFSADSRDPGSGVGFVPAENLVGKAQFIFFSTDGYARWWEIWKLAVHDSL